MTTSSSFLTAHWRNLVMLNFVVDPALLEPYVPPGTELDLWHGRSLVSLVGFQFLKTRIKGWAIPGHQNFDEVNLRFYVQRDTAAGMRRGVVFLKEIVAKPAVSWIANVIYHENYVTLPMSHEVQLPDAPTGRTGLAGYRWRMGRNGFELMARFDGQPKPVERGSEEEFITEHYWGDTRHTNGSTMEYQVDHPTWRVWQTDSAEFRGDATDLYGPQLAAILRQGPSSSLVADGSEVTVYSGRAIEWTDRTLTSRACLKEQNFSRDRV